MFQGNPAIACLAGERENGRARGRHARGILQRFVFFVSRGSLIAIGKINAKWDLWVISI